MSRPYNLRGVSAVIDALKESDQRIPAIDTAPSDTEEDALELQSGPDSDEEVNDGFEPEIHLNLDEESEGNNESGPPAKKRGKTKARGSSGRQRGVILGIDNHRWWTSPQERSEHRRSRPTRYLPSPIGDARNVSTPLEAWSLLMTESILNKIKIHTNEEIHRHRESMESESSSDSMYADVESQEIRAYFGLMYLTGLQKTVKTNPEEMWSNEYGSTLYRAVTSLRRYKFLSKMLRFDDKTTRTERKALDKFAQIRELWEEFIANCTKYYNPGSLCTVNEQILDFGERCPFKVQISSKPDKQGLKIVTLNDSRTFYMINAEPYVGEVKDVGSHNIRRLTQPIHETTRNVTCGGRFSSVELFDEMLRDHSITMVGSLRKSRPQIPESFKHPEEVGSVKFAFDGAKILLSHTAIKDKATILLSTFHLTANIDPLTKQPEIINFYNTTKGATDSFDLMCQEYTTARKTMRWATRIWMGMLDQAGINAMILYNFNSANAVMSRRDFLKALIMSMVEPQLRLRMDYPRLRRDLRLSIQAILNIEVEVMHPKVASTSRGRCNFCPRSFDRKVRVFCDICKRAVCDEHRNILCTTCFTQL